MHVEIPAGQAIRIQFDDGRETSIAAVPAAVPQSKRRSNVLVCSMLFRRRDVRSRHAVSRQPRPEHAIDGEASTDC